MQQLFAKIKRNSKYAYQNEHAIGFGYGLPFKVSIVPSFGEYCVQGGPGGQYRLADVQLFIKDDNGAVIRIA